MRIRGGFVAMSIDRALEQVTCAQCHKKLLIRNAAARGVRLEPVTAATHCDCPPDADHPRGGPAYVPPAPHDTATE